MIWTYYNEKVMHFNINMYEPFCKELRERIHKLSDIPVKGTYATTKGPQFETRAESEMLRRADADIVGMTVAPEARLAKELELCYQPLCIVVNYVNEHTTHKKALKNLKNLEEKIKEIINLVRRHL